MKTTNAFLTISFTMLFIFTSGICNAQELHAAVNMPVYNGGLPALNEFIKQNSNNHEEPGQNKVTGIVTVGYIVNKEGKVDDIKVLRGINAKCDSEAIRVTKLITGWKPGEQFGNPVSVRVTMPIEFSLIEDHQKEKPFLITGNVCERISGNPLTGVLVLVKGTYNGTVTDKNGNYNIEVPGEEFELEFSLIGYTGRLEKIGKNRIINTELLPEDLAIDFSSN